MDFQRLTLFPMVLMLVLGACGLPEDSDSNDNDDESGGGGSGVREVPPEGGDSDAGTVGETADAGSIGADAGVISGADTGTNVGTPDTGVGGVDLGGGGTADLGGGGGGECIYPTASGALRLGQIWPEMAWPDAYDPEGNILELNLNDVYCEQTYSSISLVVGTGWCPYCPDYIQWVDSMAGTLETNNSLLVFLEAQTANYQPADGAYAQNYINNLGVRSGLRIGDANNTPRSDVIISSPDITGFPTGYVIRTSDMQIVADQNLDAYYVDYAGLTADIEGIDVGVNPGEPGCTEDDEESYEPNDTIEEAATIGDGEVVTGGICNANADYYFVDIADSWSLNLEFSHIVGDIDVYAWNVETNQPLTRSDGSVVGGESTSDNESFSWRDPTTIMIYGYGGAMAPYTLTVTSR